MRLDQFSRPSHSGCFWQTTTVDVPAKPDLMMDLEPTFIQIRQALDEEEDASLNRRAAGIVVDRSGIAEHRFSYRPDNRIAAKEQRPGCGKRGKDNSYRPVQAVIKNPGRPSKGDERRKREAARLNRRLEPVREHSPLGARHASAGDTRQAGNGQRHAQLIENSQTLQSRVVELEMELRTEVTAKLRALHELDEVKSEFGSLQRWHCEHHSTLVPKTQVERDLEQEQNHRYDLWRAEVAELQRAHKDYTDGQQALHTQTLQEAEDRYKALLDAAQAQGFLSGVPLSSTPDTRRSLRSSKSGSRGKCRSRRRP